MSAQTTKDQSTIEIRKTDLREHLLEVVAQICWHGDMVCRYLEAGDDGGEIYQARQMLACVRTFLKGHNDLVDLSMTGDRK